MKAVITAANGETAIKIAERLERTPWWVFKWVSRYTLYGLKGLKDSPRSGQPTKLNSEQAEQFKIRVLAGPQEKDGGLSRFTGKHLVHILEKEFGVQMAVTGVYHLLKRLRISHITPRPQEHTSAKKDSKWL